MQITTKSITSFLKQFGIVCLFAVPIGWMMCGNCLQRLDYAIISALVSIFIWSVMWFGNGYIADVLNRKISWLEQPATRFTVGVLAMVVYTVLAMTLVDMLIDYFFNSGTFRFSWKNALQSGGIALLITTIIALFLHASAFYSHWRQEVLNVEKLKSETIASKYETLKNQVNPHFLFNSLNVLTTLVYQDQDLAAQFIKKLSNVYRYVLETKDEETILIDRELEFVNDYIFLQKIRFGDNLIFKNAIQKTEGIRIAPLSIQLLVENAVKHNEISAEKPLVIELRQEDGYLVVTNNLQKKNIVDDKDSKIGLNNLAARYDYLTSRLVEIFETSSSFTVKLPVIK